MTASYYCLISAEGTLIRSFRWNGPVVTLPRFHEVQMLDELCQPMPQPYPDPPEHLRGNPDDWILDFWNLPGGWQIVQLSEDEWEETQIDGWMKEWDGATIRIREGCEIVPDRDRFHVERLRKGCQLVEGLQIAHTTAGGKPCWRIDPQTKKTEADFPSLTFTQNADERILPVSPEERFTAGIKNAALLALSQRKTDVELVDGAPLPDRGNTDLPLPPSLERPESSN